MLQLNVAYLLRLTNNGIFIHNKNDFSYVLIVDLTARLSWINWENLGVNPSRRSVLTSLALTTDNMS